MEVIKEQYINLNNICFCHLTKIKNRIYGLNGTQCSIFIYDRKFSEEIPSIRIYRKIIPFYGDYQFGTDNKINKEISFLAIDNIKSSSFFLYKLDEHLSEIEAIQLNLETKEAKVEDIYYDIEKGILYILSSKKIEKYNLNGDNLGTFLFANNETVYKAICIHEDLVFIAYNRNMSLYVAILTKDGSFIKKISLESEYSIKNMFVTNKNGVNVLRLFATKKGIYQFFIDIKFSLKNKADSVVCSDIELECFCDDENIESTCFFEQ